MYWPKNSFLILTEDLVVFWAEATFLGRPLGYAFKAKSV